MGGWKLTWAGPSGSIRVWGGRFFGLFLRKREMSQQSQAPGTAEMMFKKLLLVLLGFFVLVLSLMLVGFAGNIYYSRAEEAKEAELAKQDEFAMGVPLKEEEASEEEEVAASSDLPDEPEASPEAEAATPPEPVVVGEETLAGGPPLWPGQEVLPAPDVDVTVAEIEEMRTKAALIHTTLGTMVFELYPTRAPRSVTNFIYLAEKGFYNGRCFYRTSPGVFFQTGSPSDMRGGTAGYWLDMDPAVLPAAMGTIAMLQVPQVERPTMGSEFVIFTRDGDSIASGQAAVFGRIIDRFDVAEKTADTLADKNAYTTDRVYITKVEIVEVETVRPEVDFWENYGKEEEGV